MKPEEELEYRQGWLAYFSGIGWRSNPHIFHSCESDRWEEGWRAAKKIFLSFPAEKSAPIRNRIIDAGYNHAFEALMEITNGMVAE